MVSPVTQFRTPDVDKITIFLDRHPQTNTIRSGAVLRFFSTIKKLQIRDSPIDRARLSQLPSINDHLPGKSSTSGGSRRWTPSARHGCPGNDESTQYTGQENAARLAGARQAGTGMLRARASGARIPRAGMQLLYGVRHHRRGRRRLAAGGAHKPVTNRRKTPSYIPWSSPSAQGYRRYYSAISVAAHLAR